MLGILLLLAGGIELCNALLSPRALGITAALDAALLVVAAFGAAFLLGSLAPSRGGMGMLSQVLLYLVVSLSGSVLFLCWFQFWMTGVPVNADALRMLLSVPLQSSLHLLSTAPLLLVLLAAVLLLPFAGAGWTIRLSRRAGLLWRPATRALLCVLCMGGSAYCVARIITADGGSASYGSLLDMDTQDPGDFRHSCTISPVTPVTPVTPAVSKPGNGRPVIVIVLESARSDLLASDRGAMPNLASLASESVVLDRAYSTSTHTDYAAIALWYSRYPLRARGRTGYPAAASWRGLSAFEYFKLNGYSTAYFSSQNEKWGGMINWLKIPGVDTFVDSENYAGETWYNRDDANDITAMIRSGLARSGKVEDSETLRLAGDWIERHDGEPFFVGLNLQNTHYHYYIPEGGAHPWQPDELGFRTVFAAWPADQAPVVRNRYLNAAWNMDVELGRFVQRLRDSGVWDRSIVLVVGDHGEAFFEHGVGNHSGATYDEVARSLALLKLPKGDRRAGSRLDTPVSHIDLMPTVVGLAGLQPWRGFQGMPVWQRAKGEPLYLNVDALVRQSAVVSWPWKLMATSFPAYSVELFHLEADQGEKHNLALTEQDVAVRLLNNLREWETCQISYYSDAGAHASRHPPRYTLPPLSAAAPLR